MRKKIPQLHSFLLAMPVEGREEFAARCGTSVAYLTQLALGHRLASASMAIAIDRASDGAIPAESIRPGSDWEYIRGQAAAPAPVRAGQ